MVAGQPDSMSENNFDTSILNKEIIGTTPPWITRWGITLILVILVGMGLASTMIKYPVSRHYDALITYETRPLTLTVPENSMLTSVFVNDTGSVAKGQTILAIENSSGRQYDLNAPFAGRFYPTDRWKPDVFANAGQVIGFLVPNSDQRIIRLRMTAGDVLRLNKGQKVNIRIDQPAGLPRSILGYIDLIGPAFQGQVYHIVNIRFPAPELAYLSSLPSLNATDSLHCDISVTIDTTSYLGYFFHRTR
jgi:hypothetical protein